GATLAGILHAGNTVPPTMPSGYAFRKMVGWVRTDAASNFYRVRQIGPDAQYIIASLPAAPLVVDSGPVGTYDTTSPVLNATAWNAFAPAVATKLRLLGSNCYKGLGSHGILLAPSITWGGNNNG